MSLHNIMVPNNGCYYINCIKGDTNFHNDVTIQGDLVVDGTITGDIVPGTLTPGLPNQFIQTNPLGTAAEWRTFSPTMIPISGGSKGDVLTIGDTEAEWATSTNPNSTLINYQVADLNIGTGNVISSIQDSLGNNYIDLVTGGNTTITSAGNINVSTNNVIALQASQGYTVSIPPTKIFAVSGSGSFTNSSNSTFSGNFTASNATVNLTALANTTTANILYYNTANGRLTYGAVPSSIISSNYTKVTLPINTGATTIIHSLTVPANSITAIGDTYNFSFDCDEVNSGGAPQGPGLQFYVNGVQTLNVTNSIGAATTQTANFTGGFAVTALAAGLATIELYVNASYSTTASGLIFGRRSSVVSFDITTPFTINIRGFTGSTTTVSCYWSVLTKL